MMTPGTAAVLSMVLAVSLFPTGATAIEQPGTFQGEGVEFAVRYWAGGVGHSPEREAAEASREYSVRVLFATPERAFLANVGVTVTDAEGRDVFRIFGAGPVILLGLPKGAYAFEGSYHGAAHRYPRVLVDPAQRRDVVFVFPE